MLTVIMAGGRGTRIAGIAGDIPKPLIPVCGKPVLEMEIECLCTQGFRDIIITVSHMGGKIMDYFGDGSRFGAHISYYFEKEPLGNAGALFRLRGEMARSGDDSFLLLNADSVFDIDFQRLVNAHETKDADVTLFTHPNSHPYDSGLVITSEDGAVMQWLSKEDSRPRWYKNRVNAGIHVIRSSVLDGYMAALADSRKIPVDNAGTSGNESAIVPDGKTDLDRDILKPLAGSGRMYAYDSPEYVKDMGTPERFFAVCRDYEAGIAVSKNLSRRQKAVFLDRDGTINVYKGFLRDIDEFELLPDAAEAVRRINESGFLAIAVTNQPVVARGEVTFGELAEIHNKMETLLGEKGAYLDGIYFCPHHPDGGYEGEVAGLKFDCGCRKPKPGMLLKAAEDFNIDLSESWMVGDSENDVMAGRNAGCHTGLIRVGIPHREQPQDRLDADLTGASLGELVDRILNGKDDCGQYGNA